MAAGRHTVWFCGWSAQPSPHPLRCLPAAAALEEHRQWREQQQERGDEESGSGSDQPARGPGRPRLDGAPAQRHTPVAEDASLKELDWLQLPGRSIAAAEKAVAAIKQPAVQGLKQQLGRQEAELLDELERERATSAAAPPPVGASTAPHAGAGLGEADRGLVDASSSLARAAPPADVAGMRQPDVAQLVQLAALCGAG